MPKLPLRKKIEALRPVAIRLPCSGCTRSKGLVYRKNPFVLASESVIVVATSRSLREVKVKYNPTMLQQEMSAKGENSDAQVGVHSNFWLLHTIMCDITNRHLCEVQLMLNKAEFEYFLHKIDTLSDLLAQFIYCEW